MGKARKPRSDAKIYQLPRAVLDGVNERLVNYNMSYADIVAWLAEQGYKVSQSSLSRYAFKVFESAQRVADDLEKTKYIHAERLCRRADGGLYIQQYRRAGQ